MAKKRKKALLKVNYYENVNFWIFFSTKTPLIFKNLDELSYGIQDTPDIQSSIELDQFEKLFFDNLNGDLVENDEDLYNSVSLF